MNTLTVRIARGVSHHFTDLPRRTKVGVVAASVFTGLAIGSMGTLAAIIPGLGLAAGISISLMVGIAALSVLLGATTSTTLFILAVQTMSARNKASPPLPVAVEPAPQLCVESPASAVERALIPARAPADDAEKIEASLQERLRSGALREYTTYAIDHGFADGPRFIGTVFRVALPPLPVGSAERLGYLLDGEIQYAGKTQRIRHSFESSREASNAEELMQLCFGRDTILRLPSTSEEEMEAPLPGVLICDDFEVISKDESIQGEGSSCDITPYLSSWCKIEGKIKQKDGAVLKHLLVETYGERLITHVFRRYDLDKQKKLSRSDLLKIMIGVATQVTVNDVRGLFDSIKSGSLFALKDSLKKSNPGLYEEIRGVARFDQLSHQHLAFLYSGFTTLPHQVTQESLKGEKNFLFLHDLNAHRITQSWNRLSREHPESAYGEYLGKSLAYIEAYPGRIFPMPPADFKPNETPVLYSFIDGVIDQEDGLIAYLLEPLNGADEKEGLRIVFRGTQPNRGALAAGGSVVRDLDPSGIGLTIYRKHKQALVAMLQKHLQKPQHLWISGHSLGGVDAQRFLVSLFDRKELPSRCLSIHCTTYNAPYVEAAVNERFKQLIAPLKPFPVHLWHHRFFDQAHPDAIQTLGEVLLGNGVVSFVEMRLIKITLLENFGRSGIGQRHGARTFNEALCKIPYQVEDISRPRELLKEMTGSKASILRYLAQSFIYCGAVISVYVHRTIYQKSNGTLNRQRFTGT